jgi:2-C-methyl-D-erythritol 4-phosphate cytidylyltransferase
MLPLERPVLLLVLVHNFNRPLLDSNLLEYHLEASRAHNATTASVQVEEVPLQAMPEGLKSFLDNQCQVRKLCGRQHMFVAPIPF